MALCVAASTSAAQAPGGPKGRPSAWPPRKPTASKAAADKAAADKAAAEKAAADKAAADKAAADRAAEKAAAEKTAAEKAAAEKAGDGPKAAEEAGSVGEPASSPEARPDRAEDGDDGVRRLLGVTAGGSWSRLDDPDETAASRGSLLAAFNVAPLEQLDIEARWQAAFGDWTYVLQRPAFDGPGAMLVDASERYYRFDLVVRYDVMAHIARGSGFHLMPHAQGVFVALDSTVYSSQLYGAGGGLDLAYDVTDRFVLDGSFAAAAGGGPAEEDSMFGALRSAWNWGGGVSMGVARFAAVRLGYAGESLVRERSTRTSHGLQLSFNVRFLKTGDR